MRVDAPEVNAEVVNRAKPIMHRMVADCNASGSLLTARVINCRPRRAGEW